MHLESQFFFNLLLLCVCLHHCACVFEGERKISGSWSSNSTTQVWELNLSHIAWE